MHLNIKLQSFYLQSLLNIKYSLNGSLQGNKCLYLVHKWKSSHIENPYGKYDRRKSLETEREHGRFLLLNLCAFLHYSKFL